MDANAIDLEQIRTILAIAEMRSFSKAAASLGVHQSAISHQMRRIETKLGRTLFHRDRGGVALTADGEAMLIYAQAIATLTDEMRRYFRDPEGVQKLRIGLNEDFSRTALPNILGLFIKAHPSFRIVIVGGDTQTLFRELDNGNVDLVVTRSHALPLRGEVLWTERMAWVGRSDTKLPLTEPIPLITPPSTSGLTTTILSTLRDSGLTWHVLFESWSLANLESALRAGIGVSAFPQGMALLDLVHLKGSTGLPELPDATFVIEQRRSPPSASVDAFCTILRNAAMLSFKQTPAARGT